MKTKFVAALLAITAFSGCATSSMRRRSLDHYLPGVREMLQGFADSESKNEVDYFFVSPVSHHGARDFAYAYWMTGNSIVILDLPAGKLEDYSWYAYKACIDLAKDVVPTPDDVHGSSYLCSSDYIEATLRDCLRGVKVVVEKKKANEPSERKLTAITPPANEPGQP